MGEAAIGFRQPQSHAAADEWEEQDGFCRSPFFD